MDLLPAGWITAQEAQRLTGYNAEHLTRLARTGQVTSRKIGPGWVFDRDNLLAHQRGAKPGRKPSKKD